MKYIWLLLVALLLRQPADALILTPDLQGTFIQNGISISVGYGTVNENTALSIYPTSAGVNLTFTPEILSTEIPLLLQDQQGMYIADAPGNIAPVPAGTYLIYFDTVQVFAQHEANREALFALGMLENYQPNLPIERTRPGWSATMSFTGTQRRLIVTNPDQHTENFLAASGLPRYADLFQGQLATHPATFQILGWADSTALPQIVQAMFPQIPRDADLPLPGERLHPLALQLPFDCAQDWWVSWGYHFSTQQNRFAVDFAAAGGRGSTQGLPIYAAHAGTLYLKVFGEVDHYIDLGIAARVLSPDGLTSTEYGHLDPASLLHWQLEQPPAFEWLAVGEVAAGEIIGYAGSTGYSTGAHIHFALWTYDQSIYRPQFDVLGEIFRGLSIPAAARQDCDLYEERTS